ncbi:Putative mycofactocin radical SAM maturase MftC [Thalassocella blandensis]|nr:Putative mycofactocin radical SAM maturase MftC [Thalassocella blandensis]
MLDTRPLLAKTSFPAIKRNVLTTLQVNLGYLCNLSCTHCHVNAGPKRTELASRETIEDILTFIDKHSIKTLDITGGAPEMNDHFKYLVREARSRGLEVIDRCNLTILNEPGYEHMAEFLAENKVTIVASLPCYSEENVKQQRGNGVFESSITALQKLNEMGYASQKDLALNLVYNPNGAFLPPGQEQLQQDYKRKLADQFNIQFNELYTITNMPIERFGGTLLAKGQYEGYMDLLKNAYSAANLSNVMCLNLISVDWKGYVYDCDFNQMLHWPMIYHHDAIATDKPLLHLRDLLEASIENNPIVVGEHCYGCTAGQGSSCGGALN